MAELGSVLFALGAFVTMTNAYLSLLRYPIHRLRGGTMETYQWISGVPLVGSLFLWLSIPLLPWMWLRWIAGVLSLFDTAGIHWFVVMMWWSGQLGDLIRGRKDTH